STMDYYIFTLKPPPGSESRAILEARFEDGLWPLNLSTPHQKDLKEGDRILFYVAGSSDPHGYHIVAQGEVAGTRRKSSRKGGDLPDWLGVSSNLYDVPVRGLKWFYPPVDVKPIVLSLAFIKNKERWGTYFQGGVRRIPEADFN